MPKPRKKRKPAPAQATQPSNQPQSFPRWIRYSAAVIILLLMLGAIVGALAGTPAKAAELRNAPSPSVSFSPLPSCAPIDTDHDGITNNVDNDIDGDGIVNGIDPDIDGDGIANNQDADPAATNCEASTAVPANFGDSGFDDSIPLVWRLMAVGAIVAAGAGYILLRIRRGKSRAAGKLG
ncbi:MAG: hypothetical protein ACKOWJ_00625 [Micrococcales bacterium]